MLPALPLCPLLVQVVASAIKKAVDVGGAGYVVITTQHLLKRGEEELICRAIKHLRDTGGCRMWAWVGVLTSGCTRTWARAQQWPYKILFLCLIACSSVIRTHISHVS
jgi:hypothetical protein